MQIIIPLQLWLLPSLWGLFRINKVLYTGFVPVTGFAYSYRYHESS